MSDACRKAQDAKSGINAVWGKLADEEITQKVNLADPFQALNEIEYTVAYDGKAWVVSIPGCNTFATGFTPVGAIINAEIAARRRVRGG